MLVSPLLVAVGAATHGKPQAADALGSVYSTSLLDDTDGQPDGLRLSDCAGISNWQITSALL